MTASTSTGGKPNDRVHIVKVHGDLARDVVHFTPGVVESAVRSNGTFIRPELRGDLIMVGPMMGEDPLDRWLAHSGDRQLWWVAPEPPSDRARFESWAPERFELLEETARPQIFFPQLTIRLVRPPWLQESRADAFGGGEAGAVGGPVSLPEPTPALADVLQGEVRQTQSLLYSLEQEALPGLRSPSTQAQLHLQQYLDQQGEMVKTQLSKESPNQLLVSALLGATRPRADRLLTEYGAGVVSPEDLRQLAAFAPMASAKLML